MIFRFLPLLLLPLAMLFGGWDSPSGFLQKETKGPDTDSIEREFDFGTVVAGTKYKHTYRIKNTGDAPLLIKSVRSSCGCLRAAWTLEPVLPGEYAQISLTYNSGEGTPGYFYKLVPVQTNIPADRASLLLVMKGQVKEPRRLLPGR